MTNWNIKIIPDTSEILRSIENKYIVNSEIDYRNALEWPIKRHKKIISMLWNENNNRWEIENEAINIIKKYNSKNIYNSLPLSFLIFKSSIIKKNIGTITHSPIDNIREHHVNINWTKYNETTLLSILISCIDDEIIN